MKKSLKTGVRYPTRISAESGSEQSGSDCQRIWYIQTYSLSQNRIGKRSRRIVLERVTKINMARWSDYLYLERGGQN